MAEGLDPIEAGKKLHEHGENSEAAESPERHSRAVQICEALLLALVTLTAAWTGYAAARWGTSSRVDIAEASTMRDLATRNSLTALSLRDFDASTFDAWFIAYTRNDKNGERIAERRFRDEFRIAFDAWLKTRPFQNPKAPPGPRYMPEYKLATAERSRQFDQLADDRFESGNAAGATGDRYVRITVFLAAVLFLVGISSSFQLYGLRYALVAVGSVLLIVSVVLILRLPGLPD